MWTNLCIGLFRGALGVRSVTVLPRPASPKKVGSARTAGSGSPRPKALALHVDDDTTILGRVRSRGHTI
jgi:hypothetical protein